MAGVANISQQNQDLLADFKSTIPFEVLRKLSACVKFDMRNYGSSENKKYNRFGLPTFIAYIKRLGYTCLEFFELLWEAKIKLIVSQKYKVSNMISFKKGICRSKEGFCIMAIDVPQLQSLQITRFIIKQVRELTVEEGFELNKLIPRPRYGGPPNVIVPLFTKLAMQAGCNQEELTCLCGSGRLVHRPGACMDCGEDDPIRQVWAREALSLGARFNTVFARHGGQTGCYIRYIHNSHYLTPEQQRFNVATSVNKKIKGVSHPLRLERLRLGIKVTELAREMKMSESYLSTMERGRHTYKAEWADKVSKKLEELKHKWTPDKGHQYNSQRSNYERRT